MGLLLGKSDFIHKNSVVRYHDGVAWLMQISMFLVLGLLVFPSRLVPVANTGLLLSVLLMFVARPVSVLAALAFFRDISFKERIMISWVGLRGAAPIILATFPLIAGLENADLIFNLVFFIVLTSVLLQGTTIPFVAKRLGLEAPLGAAEGAAIELPPTESTTAKLQEFLVRAGAKAVGKQLVDLGFPKEALIVLVFRANRHVVPKGDTVLEAGDRVLVLLEPNDYDRVRSFFDLEQV